MYITSFMGFIVATRKSSIRVFSGNDIELILHRHLFATPFSRKIQNNSHYFRVILTGDPDTRLTFPSLSAAHPAELEPHNALMAASN